MNIFSCPGCKRHTAYLFRIRFWEQQTRDGVVFGALKRSKLVMFLISVCLPLVSHSDRGDSLVSGGKRCPMCVYPAR